eukprot:4429158-Prymnesium_polylepis.1
MYSSTCGLSRSMDAGTFWYTARSTLGGIRLRKAARRVQFGMVARRSASPMEVCLAHHAGGGTMRRVGWRCHASRVDAETRARWRRRCAERRGGAPA